MKPEVYTSLIALLCNLILGFVLVLGIPFGNGYGFKACPIVTVVVIWCQCIILFSYWIKSGDNTTSDSSSPSQAPYSPTKPSQWISTWTEQITMERIRTYTHLYFPAALAISSDFWRMGVIGAIAARLGETEVGLFNASYRILWITLIFIGAIAGASGIKIALRLGKGKALKARQAAAVGLILQLLFLLTLSVIVYCNIRMFGQLFTNDESYLNLFEECRLPFTCVLFFMNLSVGIETIPISMGQTGNVFYAGFVASWLGQVPFVILLVHFWQDLYAIYTGVAVGYCILTIIYGWLAYSSDFVKYSEMARQRAEQ